MGSQFLDQFAIPLVLLGVAICVTLVAIWAGQSHWHWFFRGSVVAAVLALFLPVRAHEPLLFFLIAAPVVSLGVAWMESRRERASRKKASAGAGSMSKSSRQLSLAGAFLVLALVGMACGLGSAAIRGGVLMDWRYLPVSALMFAAVATLSYRVGAFSQGISDPWARGVSLLIGAGLFAWYALRGRDYVNLPGGAAAGLAAYAWWLAIALVCMLVFVVCYFECRFGSSRHFAALVGLLFVVPRIELRGLGDWMFLGDLLPLYVPTAPTYCLIFLAIPYALFATALVVSVALGRLAFSTTTAAWQKYPLRAAGICAAGLLLYSLGGVYWRLAWTMAPPAMPMTERGENPLERALPLLDEFYALEYPDRGFFPGDKPKGVERNHPGEPMAAVYARLVEQLQKPGRAPLNRRATPFVPSRQSQELMRSELMAFSMVLHVDAQLAIQRKDFDGALPYVRAQMQLEDNLHRGGSLMDRQAFTTGWLNMAALRNELSTTNARQVLLMLRRFEREREPFDVALAREQAWEEREFSWRFRLRQLKGNPKLRNGLSTLSLHPWREMDHRMPTSQRLLCTDFALRLYREDHGRFPHQLSELVPKYLDAVPIDPYCDKPLVYKATDGKYRLYTVWFNGLDDGGKTGAEPEEQWKNPHMDYDLDTMVRHWAQAQEDAKVKGAQDARPKGSMRKAQKGGTTTTSAPKAGK
jgi:hypothetical protein